MRITVHDRLRSTIARMRALVFTILLLGCGGGGDPPNVGAACTATGGCDEDLTCNTSVPGGYCTQACTSPGTTAECPDDSICDAIAGTSIACVKICKSSSDCRS